MPDSNQNNSTVDEHAVSLVQSHLPIAAKLDQARMGLLDLSARNRLLNTPRSSKNARTIEVIDEKSSEIYRLLVQEERVFTFSAGRTAKKDAAEVPDQPLDEPDEIWDLAQPEDDAKNDRGVLLRHADTQLQTRLTSKGLQKRLLEMYTDAITLEQEQGVNILYLTLGMLRWVDPNNAANLRYAPLVLIPVQLERSSAADRFKLRWRKEDIASNLSLEAYLDREHRLKLPEFETDDFDLAAYCDAVAETISQKAGWAVLTDDIVLGFFSFAKFLMYRDLDAECWPEEESLATRPLIRGLLAEGFPHQSLTIPEDALVDDYIAPSEMLHVADADGSQMKAVHEARQGRSLVIQGPPGTGKSQTIANIIASAIADGKSVLFVAEKMVALSVVKARLDRAGVGDACLELHSNKANKRGVLQELKRTWELGSPHGVVRDSLNENLQRTRDALNVHAAVMNTPHGVAKLTPFEVAGEIAMLMQQGIAHVDFDLDEATGWSPDDVLTRQEMLRNFAHRVGDIGPPAEHPWRGVGLSNLLPTDVSRLLQVVQKTADAISALHQASTTLREEMGFEGLDSFKDLDDLQEVTRKIASAPALSELALTASEWADCESDLQSILEAGETQRRLFGELTTILRSPTSPIALESELAVLRALPDQISVAELDRIQEAAQVSVELLQLLPQLQRSLRLKASTTDTRQDLSRVMKIAKGVSEAPDADNEAFSSAVWKQGLDKAESLARAAAQAETSRAAIGDKLAPAAWDNDLSDARRILASHGTGLLRHLSGEWRSADRLVRSFLQNPKAELNEVLALLDQHSLARKAQAELLAGTDFGRDAFGSAWRGERSSSSALEAMTAWMNSLGSMREDIRMLVAASVGREEIKRRYQTLLPLSQTLDDLLAGLDRLLSISEESSIPSIAAATAQIASADRSTREPFLSLPSTLHERLKRLQQWLDLQDVLTILQHKDSLAVNAFGDKWRGADSDWSALHEATSWMAANGALRFVAAKFPVRNEPGERLESLLQRRDVAEESWHALTKQLLSGHDVLFPQTPFLVTPARALLERLEGWLTNGEQLSKWVAFQASDRQLRSNGLATLADRIGKEQWPDNLAQAKFAMGYYEAVLREQFRQVPELAAFDGKNHTDLVDRFKTLDKERISASAIEVVRAHHKRIPLGGGIGPVGVLRGEIAKKSRHLPLRQLMAKAGQVVQALKPVFMMSPLSIAQFLPPGKISFDLLVMDEASQIQPVDALGAIARCRQVVVVGDERQLPPTRFFAKMTSDVDESDEEEEDTTRVGDVESILGLFIARGLPQRMLRWHYRSRHQSLIAVSNSEFYENKLFIIPSPHTQGSGRGLRFQQVPDGVFYSATRESESRFGNPIEARVVAEAVLRHAMEHPEQSLGVATFSITQRRAILEQIERLRRLNPDTEAFFNAHPTEPFFVKNLENVQGDERDTIFISVGYGRNPQGQFPMRFGPLGMDGGERRLNVLISRAKLQCVVYASITDEDIDTERAGGKGVFALKLFLHFARTGRLAMTKSPEITERKSAFVKQAAEALADRGLIAHQNVGIAGCFVDLAVQDPAISSRYLMGIECDGPDYSRSASSRDRDRLRRSVLEDHGWTMHRVWSLDWLHRPQEQLEACLATLTSSRAAAEHDTTEAHDSGNARLEIVTIEREQGTEMGLAVSSTGRSNAYIEAVFAPPALTELHETPTGILAKCVYDIVCVEGPIHEDEITVRLRSVWGLARSGQRVQAAAERAISHAEAEKMIERDGVFLLLADQGIVPRDRSSVSSASLRRPEMISPKEIEAAILHTVRSSFGGSEEEIAIAVSRAFGFQARSALLRSMVASVLVNMRESGAIRASGDLWMAVVE